MRYRSGLLALTIAALTMACAPAPAAASQPPTPPASIDSAPAFDSSLFVLPTVLSAATESVHVYLLTQLAVSAAVGGDSAALQQLVTHAAHTLVAAYAAEQIPIARGTVFLRQSDTDRLSSTPRLDSLPVPQRAPRTLGSARLARPASFARLTRL